jgi:SynChlorMet cassette protein ScmC
MTIASYHIRLADHSEWAVVPSAETREMVDWAADILGLDPGAPATARRLYVTATGEMAGASRPHQEPVDRWRREDFGYGTFWFDGADGDVIFEISPTEIEVKMIRQAGTLLYPIIDGAVRAGGLPVHAGTLARDSRCVILPATGNTGKSTCCRRTMAPWHSPGDDFGLVVRAGNGDYRLHPLPTWSDFLFHRQERHYRASDSYRLSGIFFLEQGARDEVLPVPQSDAAVRLFDRAGDTLLNYVRIGQELRRSSAARFFENAWAIAHAVPVHLLRASLTGDFWTAIEREIGMA